MARFILIVCLALVASVATAPDRSRRYLDHGLNLGHGGGGGGYGHGGHGGLGYGGLVPGGTQTFSKSSASASSVSGGVALG